MQLISASRGDDLSMLLERINVRSAVYCLSELGSPWGFSVAGSQVAKFHLVLAGSALLTMDDADPDQVKLDAGELVLLPRGSAHVMHDSDGAATPPLDVILAEHPVSRAGRMSYGGDGARTSLLCGGFSLAPGLPAELLGLLPPVLVIDAASHGITRWLGPLFGLLQEIARLVGYDSDASLAKAFRRSYGRAPGAYRRQHGGPAAVLVSEFGADSLRLRRADVLPEPVA